MPTYEYRCDNCGHEFETFQSMKDEKLTTCPECGKKTLKRLIGSGSGLIFKGSGFYLTDYKNKSDDKKPLKTTSNEKKKADKDSAPVSTSTETPKTESKAETEKPAAKQKKPSNPKSEKD